MKLAKLSSSLLATSHVIRVRKSVRNTVSAKRVNVRRLVLELEAEHAVELHRAIEIAHAYADVVDCRDVDALQFSSLKPIAFTILPHFVCSDSTYRAYSCGEEGEATPPTLAN